MIFFFNKGKDLIYRQRVDIIKTYTAIKLNYNVIRIDYSQINNVDMHITKALNAETKLYVSNPELYQHILQAIWEAVKCAETLEANDPDELSLALAKYSQYCMTLYESERDAVLAKHNKIMSVNKSTSTTGVILTSACS